MYYCAHTAERAVDCNKSKDNMLSIYIHTSVHLLVNVRLIILYVVTLWYFH
jgi:hypothetical protein